MRQNKKTFLAVVIAFSLILTAGIGFALLTTTLNITGTGDVAPVTWDIHFSNLSEGVETGAANTGDIIKTSPTLTNTTVNGFDVHLAKPGDKATWTFDIVNAGGVDAVLTSLAQLPHTITGSGDNKANDETTVSSYLVYNLNYYVGNTVEAAVAEEDVLAAGDTRKVILTVGYNETATASNLPEAAVEVTLGEKTLVYTQA